MEVLCCADGDAYVVMVKTFSGLALVARERLAVYRESATLVDADFPKSFAKTRLGVPLAEAELNDRTAKLEGFFHALATTTRDLPDVFIPITGVDRTRKLSNLVIDKTATQRDVSLAATNDADVFARTHLRRSASEPTTPLPAPGGCLLTPKTKQAAKATTTTTTTTAKHKLQGKQKYNLPNQEPTTACCLFSPRILLEAAGS